MNWVPIFSRSGSATEGPTCTVRRIAYLIAGTCHDELALRQFNEGHRALLRVMLKDFAKRDMLVDYERTSGRAHDTDVFL